MTDTTIDTTDAKPNRRQIAKARTAATVLQAARALFKERGYYAATIRDIAKAVGMSTGAVFANFEDKEELFTVAMGRKPISEDQGYRAMVLLRALCHDPYRQYGAENVDEFQAIDALKAEAQTLLDETRFPALPETDALTNEDHSCADVMRAAMGLEVEAPE